MTRQELEATWIPRIGEKGTAELWRYRKIGIFGFTAGLAAAGAGLLIGTGTLNDVIGGVLVMVAAGYFVIFFRAQMRIAAALSEWYGVKIRGIPVMNPKRFDAWCEARGLHHPDEQVGSGRKHGHRMARRVTRARFACVYGPSELSVEQINNTTGAVTYLHHDQAGSTRLLTGSTGAVTGKCTYSQYGTPTCEGTTTTPFGYDSQYTSSDTGLIYLRARVYDPATAQFLTVDPLVAATRAPYNYAEDNPLNEADPSGRCGLVCVGGIVLGGVALATGVGEVAIGGGAIAEGTLAGISFVSGASASVIDTKECVGGSSVSCVGAGAGFIATGGAGLSLGVLSGNAAAGATAIGLSFGGIGFLGDTAGALASTASQSNSFDSGCG